MDLDTRGLCSGLRRKRSPQVIGYRQALTISIKSGTSRGLTVETPDGIVELTQTGPGTSGVIVDA